MIDNANFKGRSISTFRRTNDSECYYGTAEMVGALGTASIAINTLYAQPYFVGSKTRVADRISINITTTGTGNNARLGIYLDDGNIYPGTLLLNAGVVNISAAAGVGVKEINITQTLMPDTIIWLVLVADGTSTFRSHGSGGTTHPLGIPSTLTTSYNTHYSHAFNYAALPTPFPTAAPIKETGNISAVFLRLSS